MGDFSIRQCGMLYVLLILSAHFRWPIMLNIFLVAMHILVVWVTTSCTSMRKQHWYMTLVDMFSYAQKHGFCLLSVKCVLVYIYSVLPISVHDIQACNKSVASGNKNTKNITGRLLVGKVKRTSVLDQVHVYLYMW